MFVKHIGALTSKPYAFAARPWELKSVETIDVFDSVGANIRVDIRGDVIMRILPSLNEEINEEWLSDRSRFAYDGLRLQRLYTPLVKSNNNLIQVSWSKAFETIFTALCKVNSRNVGAIVGRSVDIESTFLVRKLFFKLGSSNVFTSDVQKMSLDFRNSYILRCGLKGVESADLLFISGFNPKIELPLLNIRLRRLILKEKVTLYYLGENIFLNYPYEYLGSSFDSLIKIIEGKHDVVKFLKKATKPLILVGNQLFKQPSIIMEKILQFFNVRLGKLNPAFGLNLVESFSGRVGALELGLSKLNYAILENLAFVYLLNADEFNPNILLRLRGSGYSKEKPFIVYQGHHGDVGAELADVILPGSTYTEKISSFINLEGRFQQTKAIFLPPGQSREDWKIIKALSDFIYSYLNFTSLEHIMSQLNVIAPISSCGSTRYVSIFFPLQYISVGSSFFYCYPVKTAFDNFYSTDVISRSSVTMAKCANSFIFSNSFNFL